MEEALVFIEREEAEELARLHADPPTGVAGELGALDPAHRMASWFPKDIVAKYGELTDTLLDGFFVWLDPDRVDEIVAEVESRGWSCEEDDDLVNRASGNH